MKYKIAIETDLIELLTKCREDETPVHTTMVEKEPDGSISVTFNIKRTVQP